MSDTKRWADDWIARSPNPGGLLWAIESAEQLGIKLEITDGVPTWEASPVMRHQRKIDQIRQSIRPAPGLDLNCGCVHYYDLSIDFPDGSNKRPDIAIFCEEPKEETSSVTMLPEACIEIISQGYAAKDYKISVPFYLKIGVKDVITYDPDTNETRHFRPNQPEERHTSPVTIALACGCECTV